MEWLCLLALTLYRSSDVVEVFGGTPFQLIVDVNPLVWGSLQMHESVMSILPGASSRVTLVLNGIDCLGGSCQVQGGGELNIGTGQGAASFFFNLNGTLTLNVVSRFASASIVQSHLYDSSPLIFSLPATVVNELFLQNSFSSCSSSVAGLIVFGIVVVGGNNDFDGCAPMRVPDQTGIIQFDGPYTTKIPVVQSPDIFARVAILEGARTFFLATFFSLDIQVQGTLVLGGSTKVEPLFCSSCFQRLI
jgi:hypothetical protein